MLLVQPGDEFRQKRRGLLTEYLVVLAKAAEVLSKTGGFRAVHILSQLELFQLGVRDQVHFPGNVVEESSTFREEVSYCVRARNDDTAELRWGGHVGSTVLALQKLTGIQIYGFLDGFG